MKRRERIIISFVVESYVGLRHILPNFSGPQTPFVDSNSSSMCVCVSRIKGSKEGTTIVVFKTWENSNTLPVYSITHTFTYYLRFTKHP